MDASRSPEPRGNEKYYFSPGDLGFPVFDTPFARIGILICYDRHFPEAARVLGLGGAEIVFVPTATTAHDPLPLGRGAPGARHRQRRTTCAASTRWAWTSGVRSATTTATA